MVNIEETVHTISRVIQEVELMADCKVSNVYTGIAGSHIKSFNSNGMVAIKDKEVTAGGEAVLEQALDGLGNAAIGNQPNGLNINDAVGATSPRALCEAVLANWSGP